MCNLYRLSSEAAEVARLFSAANTLDRANLAPEVYPGYSGAVIAEGELRKMSWGFPLTLKSKKTSQPLKPKPVNNTRSDKLDSFMWRYSFAERRCLIPLNAWAEAEGPRGAKTRTWLSMPGNELFAAAGIWRDSEEFGVCYSMVMTDSTGPAAEVHNRMPVLLVGSDRETWLNGAHNDAAQLCKPFEGEISIDRTDQPWAAR